MQVLYICDSFSSKRLLLHSNFGGMSERIRITLRLRQPLKINSPSSEELDGITTVCKLIHSEKAYDSRCLTVGGMATKRSTEQNENALDPIFTSPAGSLILSKVRQ